MYLTLIMNHLRAVRKQILEHGGQASIDMATFQLEIKAKSRYFTLHPQFRARLNGRLVNVEYIPDETNSFLGWLPYRPIRWTISSDKLAFKNFAAQHAIPTPTWWRHNVVPTEDYIVKNSNGSFGQNISGPFKRGEPCPVECGAAAPHIGERYFDKFIRGKNLKLWVWGKSIFHVHAAPYATIVGDGTSTIDGLVEQLAASQIPRIPRPAGDQEAMAGCLAYQGYCRGDILPKGESAWLDFRYGRGYSSPGVNEQEDNCLLRLNSEVLTQAQLVVDILSSEVESQFRVPVLYSLDGVLDERGHLWWLEMNSNPTLPPTGYSKIFNTLFER